MSVKKTKSTISSQENTEANVSTEEKIAWLTAKNALISAIAVALISLISLNLSEYIKKPSETQTKADESEIQYFNASVEESSDQFENNEIGLIESEAKIEAAISSENDAELKVKYSEIKSKLESAIDANRSAHKSFVYYANQSIDALKRGERLNASVLRKSANEQVAKENKMHEEIANLSDQRLRLACSQLIGRKPSDEKVRRCPDTLRTLWAMRPPIRGINQAEPKKTADEIAETYAENRSNESVENPKDLTPVAVAP